jgi:hypothetical protein
MEARAQYPPYVATDQRQLATSLLYAACSCQNVGGGRGAYLYLSGAHRMVAQPTPALIHLPQHPQRISLPPATLDPWVEYWYESWHVFEVALHTVANCVCSSVGAGSPSYQPIGVCRVFTVIPSLLLQFRSLDRTPPPYMYYNIGSSLFHQHIKIGSCHDTTSVSP